MTDRALVVALLKAWANVSVGAQLSCYLRPECDRLLLLCVGRAAVLPFYSCALHFCSVCHIFHHYHLHLWSHVLLMCSLHVLYTEDEREKSCRLFMCTPAVKACVCSSCTIPPSPPPTSPPPLVLSYHPSSGISSCTTVNTEPRVQLFEHCQTRALSLLIFHSVVQSVPVCPTLSQSPSHVGNSGI